ncbi:hypothetical protein Bca52824_006181 [Brassica carinata]|uniref:Tetratricopeptide repeat protein n=1 Tax=Brassica carinata TaxID=52824 RepID=A0A8X7WSQ5_BRACI|nr:hypothetical protein Bca52824_006181 [Brassica carinata]
MISVAILSLSFVVVGDKANSLNDIEALQSLMKIKLQSKNLDQSLEILNRLISLDPEEQEWRILKAQVQTYGGDFDSATKGFEEILARDPPSRGVPRTRDGLLRFGIKALGARGENRGSDREVQEGGQEEGFSRLHAFDRAD